MKSSGLGLLTVVLALVFMVGMPGQAGAVDSLTGVQIATVPAVAGFPIALDGELRSTDGSGIAVFTSRDRDNLTSRLTLHDMYSTLDGRRVHIKAARLFERGPDPQLGLDIDWLTTLSYVNPRGEEVPSDQIDKVRIKSSVGEELTLAPGEPVYLQGSRVVSLPGGLENKNLYWSVQDIQCSGSNVVNASQQRFQPADAQAVTIGLLFFPTRFKVHDAFFGWGTGDAVLLTYPDQNVATYRLGNDSGVALPSLPRGDYSVVVSGSGPSMSLPLAISRDQVVDLAFYSWLDIAVAFAMLSLFLVVTLLIGHRRRRRHTTRPPQREVILSGVTGHEPARPLVRLVRRATPRVVFPRYPRWFPVHLVWGQQDVVIQARSQKQNGQVLLRPISEGRTAVSDAHVDAVAAAESDDVPEPAINGSGSARQLTSASTAEASR